MGIYTSIKYKLRLAFLLIILIAAIGSSYSLFLILKSKEFLGYREQVVTMVMNLKEARIQEKNFILFDRKNETFLKTGTSDILIKHQYLIDSILQSIDSIALNVKSNDPLLYLNLASLKDGVHQYEKNFHELKNLYFIRGFKDYGLEGNMRGSVHALQECISDAEKVFAFSLRRHEKDFMLRKDLKYQESLVSTAILFSDYVTQSHATHTTTAYKSHNLRVIDEYVNKFNEIVEVEKKIGLSETEGVLGELNKSADELVKVSHDVFASVDHESRLIQKNAILLFLCSILLTIIAGIAINFILNNRLIRPLLLLNQVIKSEIEGSPRNNAIDQITSKDEIGDLTRNFKRMMEKMDNHMSIISEKNKSLEITSREDRKRKWIAEGVSSYMDLMKNSNDSMTEIGYGIISGMVKYIDANQGGLFLIDDLDNPQKMELIASFAYDRKKYLQKEVIRGEGLIGAAWEEKQVVKLDDIPQDYLTITSGLGYTKPNKLVIVPIINNGQVFGVIEIASFNPFEQHHIDLIQRTCDRLASTFESHKSHEKTTMLLHTSQQQAEELRAQEEEMRQNLEEMAATQEDFSRRELELKEIIKKLKEDHILLDEKISLSSHNNHCS